MRFKLNSVILAGLLAIASVSLRSAAQNAQPVPLDEQLKAQYTIIQTCGTNGTALVVQKDGIVGSPQTLPVTLTTKYEGGKLHSPPSPHSCPWCPVVGAYIDKANQASQQTRTAFNRNQKLYPTSIQANLGKDTVTIGVLACDLGSKANVLFQFSKGTLQKMGAPEVVDVISQVLAFDQPAEPAAAPEQNIETAPAQPSSAAPPSEAPQIRIGETIDQVLAAFGQPEKKVDLGSKQIYVYKDLKVTFQDGKVSGAE